jgi:hypothetical protein
MKTVHDHQEEYLEVDSTHQIKFCNIGNVEKQQWGKRVS